jgi:hypothetical protein
MWTTIRLHDAKPEFATVQAKTQTSASPLTQESYLFTDPPLIGKSMNLGATFETLQIIYSIYQPKILVIPEANPQRKSLSPAPDPNDRNFGWPNETMSALGWIDTVVRVLQIGLRAFPVEEVYVHFYRWARDEWDLSKREDIRNGLIEIARMAHRT